MKYGWNGVLIPRGAMVRGTIPAKNESKLSSRASGARIGSDLLDQTTNGTRTTCTVLVHAREK